MKTIGSIILQGQCASACEIGSQHASGASSQPTSGRARGAKWICGDDYLWSLSTACGKRQCALLNDVGFLYAYELCSSFASGLLRRDDRYGIATCYSK